MTQKLAACDEEGAAQALAQGYVRYQANQEINLLVDDCLDYAAKTRNDRLIRAIAKYFCQIPADSASRFKTKHGAKLVQLTLPTARNDLAENRTELALAVLEGLEKLAPKANYSEVLLELGRAQELTQKDVLARQTWDTIIQNGDRSPTVEMAYYLMILSLRRAKKDAEAKQMQLQFLDRLPGSVWQQAL